MNSKRLAAFFVDFIITAVIMEIPFFILIIFPLIKGNSPSGIVARTLASTLIAFIYLILRDLPAKGSIGKRIFKLKVIDSETKELATAKQRLLRNIPLLLNWIEIIIFLVSNNRLGDRIAKTDVVEQ